MLLQPKTLRSLSRRVSVVTVYNVELLAKFERLPKQYRHVALILTECYVMIDTEPFNKYYCKDKIAR